MKKNQKKKKKSDEERKLVSSDEKKNVKKKKNNGDDSYLDETTTPGDEEVKIKIGKKNVSLHRVPGCAIFIRDISDESVPKIFDLFIERSRYVPDCVVFLRIVYKHTAIVDEKNRYLIEAQGNGIFSMRINIGFGEHGIQLEDIVRSALDDLGVPEMEITYYQGSQVIKVVDKSAFRFILYFYSTFKETFPSNMRGFTIDSTSLVILNFVCPL